METKLAIFIPSLKGGGAERITLNLTQQLAKRIGALDLVLTQAEETEFVEVPDSVRVINLKSPRVLASLPALTKYLRSEQPDAMLSVMNYANIIVLWASRLARVSTRIIISEHNTLSQAHKNASRWRSRLIPSLIKVFYPWSDGIIAVSHGVADDLVQMTGLSRRSIQVIYNPVITPDIRKKTQTSIKHPWFEPGQPPVVLAVGRLTKQKDFPTLIRAFTKVHQTQPVRLIILGEGPDRPALEALVNELGLVDDVALPGFVENPYAYMSRASLYVLSSRWEGLPTVLIEALYCGLPVIATDCPSGPREILADGQHGLLVPVADVMALAQAIKAGLERKTPYPSEESWQPYSQGIVADQYISLLLNGHA